MAPAVREDGLCRSSTIAGRRALRPRRSKTSSGTACPMACPLIRSMPEADLHAVTTFVWSLQFLRVRCPAGWRRRGRCDVFLRKRAVRDVPHRARARRSRRARPVEHRPPDDGTRAHSLTSRARCDDSRRVCCCSSSIERWPHAARFRPQRRQSRAAIANNGRPPRGGGQGHRRHHARDRIRDAAADGDIGRDTGPDCVLSGLMGDGCDMGAMGAILAFSLKTELPVR